MNENIQQISESTSAIATGPRNCYGIGIPDKIVSYQHYFPYTGARDSGVYCAIHYQKHFASGIKPCFTVLGATFL